jgi:glutathione S-transferase
VESSIVIEYLALEVPRAARLLPGSPQGVLEIRARDRFLDLYVMEPMGKIVEERLRPERAPDGTTELCPRAPRSGAVHGVVSGLATRWFVSHERTP